MVLEYIDTPTATFLNHTLVSWWANHILPKSGNPGSPDSADSFEFSAERFLRTQKVSKLHCLQSYWRSFPLFMFSHCNKLSIKTLKHTIFWHQILVILMILHFCCEILLSRFTHFSRRILERTPQTESLLECMPQTSWFLSNSTCWALS